MSALEDVQEQLDALGAAIYKGYTIQLTRDDSTYKGYVILLETSREQGCFFLETALDLIDTRIKRLNY